jgi:hypothetical protein
VIKPDYDDPDLAVVVDPPDEGEVTVVFRHLLESEADGPYVSPSELDEVCEEVGISRYSFAADALSFEPQY